MTSVLRLYVGSAPAPVESRVFLALAAGLVATVEVVLAREGVRGATLHPAVGLWNGLTEASVVVVVVDPPDGVRTADALAGALARACAQDSVLWTLDVGVTARVHHREGGAQ